MGRYVRNRILQLLPALLLVSFLVFWLMSLCGDPVSTLLGAEATQAEIDAMRESMGLNRPILVRYGEYLWNLLHGDFGTDIYGKSVIELILQRWPYTLMLLGASLLISTTISIPLGIAAALNKDKFLDTALTTVCLFGASMPTFWLGLMLQIIFALNLGLFPTSGIQRGVLIGLVLPSVTSALGGLAPKCRQTRSSMLDNLNADYISTAQAKGVKKHDIVWKHALRNALLPIITTIGNAMMLSVGGSVVLESVFAWPGLGSLYIPAIRAGNYVLVCGCVNVTMLVTAALSLLIDLAYAYADPRVKARYSAM